MIKAVFFDLYYTLVRYEPPREEIQAGVLKELGISVSPEFLRRPLVTADEFIHQELARTPLGQRTEKEKMALWARYEEVLLKEAGLDADEQLILQVLSKSQQVEMELVLFDDVIPALNDLGDRGLTLGLISNVDQDMTSLFDKLGLSSLLKVIVTSQNSGFNKPQPEIFREALKRAGVEAAEAIYVGDQYQIDAVGACRAGMRGILLDRESFFPEVTDCPRVQSLVQVAEYLED